MRLPHISSSTTQPTNERYLICGDFHRFFWEFFCHILYHISLPLLRWAACINLQQIFDEKYFNINIEIVRITEIQWQQILSYLCNMNNMQRITLASRTITTRYFLTTALRRLANQNENTCFSQDDKSRWDEKLMRWNNLVLRADFSRLFKTYQDPMIRRAPDFHYKPTVHLHLASFHQLILEIWSWKAPRYQKSLSIVMHHKCPMNSHLSCYRWWCVHWVKMTRLV